MGNRYCRRPGKFYTEQVEQILALIKRNFKDTGIDINKYLALCEQLGEEPDPEKMPVDRTVFPLEVQEAYVLHDFLAERWDGASGYYLGKDYSALDTYIKHLEITDAKISLWFLKHIEYHNMQMINEKVKRQREAEKRKANIKK